MKYRANSSPPLPKAAAFMSLQWRSHHVPYFRWYIDPSSEKPSSNRSMTGIAPCTFTPCSRSGMAIRQILKRSRLLQRKIGANQRLSFCSRNRYRVPSYNAGVRDRCVERDGVVQTSCGGKKIWLRERGRVWTAPTPKFFRIHTFLRTTQALITRVADPVSFRYGWESNRPRLSACI